MIKMRTRIKPTLDRIAGKIIGLKDDGEGDGGLVFWGANLKVEFGVWDWNGNVPIKKLFSRRLKNKDY